MHFSSLAVLLPLIGGAAAAPTVARTTKSDYAVKESHAVPRGWTAVSAVEKSHPITLQIGLRQSNQDKLEQHVTEISNPSHARYGQHMSAAEVNSLIEPSKDTVDLVRAWLLDHDITTMSHSPAKDWINVEVPVEKAEELLQTLYSVFEHDDGSKLIRTSEWSLPEHLHEHIDVIQPTTSFFRPSRQASTVKPEQNGGAEYDMAWYKEHKAPKPTPGTACNITAVCNITFTSLQCLRCLYKTIDYTPQVPKKNKIGVTDYLGETQNRSDIHLYLTNFRPEAAEVAYQFPIVIVADGDNQQTQLNATQVASGKDIEGNLDGEVVLGISWPTSFVAWATGGSPPFNPDLNTPTDTNEPYLTWLTYVLSQGNLPQVISTSYGDDEQTVPYSYAKRACDGFKQLGARGISVLFSSGDSGVGGNGTCFSNTDPTKAMFLPAFPASCPWVTAVGGTQGFQPEVAVQRFGSGAGFSNYFKRPQYQKTAVEGYFGKIGDLYAGLYNTSGRGYPDVAAQGNHDVIVYNGLVRTVGGTSASSPAFAAVISLVNDALIAAGKPALGFLNPWIYGGAYKALNDVLSGSSIGCNTSGFPAEVGWDAVTGYGTPDFLKLKELALKKN